MNILHWFISLFAIFTIHHAAPVPTPPVTPMPKKATITQSVKSKVIIKPKTSVSISEVSATSSPDEIANEVNQTTLQQIMDEGKINNLEGRVINLENQDTPKKEITASSTKVTSDNQPSVQSDPNKPHATFIIDQ